MISTNDLKNGITIEYEGNIYVVMETQHVKPGKGAAIVKAKLKNLRTGAIFEQTFNAGVKVATARIEKQLMQYLYNMSDVYYFMNMDSYEQLEIPASKIGDQAKLLKELEKRLQKLVDELAEILPNTIRQADGTVVLKGYNGDTATPEEIAEQIIRNLRKRQKENRKEREYVKKHLKENPKRFIINNKEYKQIWLPEKEHGAVRSAFTTYIMQNNYTKPILVRFYGDYIYTAVLEEVDGQLLPIFVRKIKIKGVK